MIVTLEIPPETAELIRRHQDAAGKAHDALRAGLQAAVVSGADDIRAGLVQGRYELVMRHPGQAGLADCLMGWMIDEQALLGAIGVPANTPAATYATMLEYGGTIRPVRARALAVPLTAEAASYSSPRDQPGLRFIPRKGRPPLLVRDISRRGKSVGIDPQWVLVSSVTITGRHWLSQGAEEAREPMTAAFTGVLDDYVKTWS